MCLSFSYNHDHDYTLQGLSSVGKSLTDVEFNTLCELYQDPKKKDHVRWKDFVHTIEAPGN